LSGVNNCFGIKATKAQIAAGDCTLCWTHETIDGVYQKVQQHSANYPTPGDCFDAHAHLLTQPWYRLCIAARTPQEYAHALWLSHYATGIPGHPYDKALIDLMNQNNLYQYDALVTVTNIPRPTLNQAHLAQDLWKKLSDGYDTTTIANWLATNNLGA
jgi:flagellum-specific peptidoglycan hydrolase FlgJ